ncbi:hypothetical protein NHG23_05510 [Aerococcaceae bacterium NML190073]|nr:hypothetical protein [Aerococcaceae bacterium NML190073]
MRPNQLEHEYTKLIEDLNNLVVTRASFIAWLEQQLEVLSKNRKGKIEIIKDIMELPYMEHLENRVDEVLEANDRQLDYFEGMGTGKEYEDVFSVIPFAYNGKRYVTTSNTEAEVWLYDIERYGKFLGMGKEKFTNVKYYAEIGEK